MESVKSPERSSVSVDFARRLRYGSQPSTSLVTSTALSRINTVSTKGGRRDSATAPTVQLSARRSVFLECQRRV